MEMHWECIVGGPKVELTCHCISKLLAIVLACAAGLLVRYGYALEVAADLRLLRPHPGNPDHCTRRGMGHHTDFPNQAAHRFASVVNADAGN